jgi:leucyl aminopeptidase
MTALTFAPDTDDALPLHLVRPGEAEGFIAARGVAGAWLRQTGFDGSAGKLALIPGEDGALAGAALGLGEGPRVPRFAVGGVRAQLPAGTWRLVGDLSEEARDEAALGWLLEGYRFDRYATAAAPEARLVAPEGCDARLLEVLAASEALTRDLINTPAEDMGPAELEEASRALAGEFGAAIEVTEGAALLENNFPLIHTVGRAAARSPRLIDLRWGDAGPRVTLVGKGVCFDTGGLNLKPGSSMGLMKKDMGGAATVLGLARTIMATGQALRLRVLIPAVENAVSAASFRPGDILRSRKGLTVEINNTDAEGRLVLADALALATEEECDLLVSMATLTGAARVAVGPDLAPFYTDDDAAAEALGRAAAAVRDPVWRMPFWDPYESLIEPGIADLDNAPSGGMAGSITAALFLRRFAGEARYMHFDIYGWNRSAAPARPKGGVGMGARALFAALPDLVGV